ncbi:hypothetical protein, partial [Candidatus Kuenenia stuttgartiensis]|uniref:hypothetical protein n=1 Tax=Kuenenia stuttgartiensis TaxID=174633 RepID=UPI00146B70CD
ICGEDKYTTIESERLLRLPLYYDLTIEEVDYITKHIEKILLMIKIATPISHLFENEDRAKRIINYSNCLECRDISINSTIANQEVFHSELQPIHEFTKINFNYLKYIRSVKHDLKLITFHVASCCNKPYLDNKMFRMGGKEYTEKEMLKNAKQNFSIIKEIFGKE